MRPGSRHTPRPSSVVAACTLALAGACRAPEDDSDRARASGSYGRASSGPRPVEAGAPRGTVGAARLALAEDPELGAYLTDVDGRALYLFRADEEGESTCYEACAEVWPPLLTRGAPWIADPKLATELIGTTRRRDGSTQVTYGGWPLYRYVHDALPGQTTGHDLEGFGAGWYLVGPAGDALERDRR